MNTPIPFLEEAVKDDVCGIITKNSFSISAPLGQFEPHKHEIDFEATVTDLLHYFRSKFTLALEEGKKGAYSSGYESGKVIGEAAGRKSAVEYIRKSRTVHEVHGIGTKEEMARNQAIEDILQASNE